MLASLPSCQECPVFGNRTTFAQITRKNDEWYCRKRVFVHFDEESQNIKSQFFFTAIKRFFKSEPKLTKFLQKGTFFGFCDESKASAAKRMSHLGLELLIKIIYHINNKYVCSYG